MAKDVSERQQLEFKTECRNFLQATVVKLLEKCPITYSLARCLTCLDPRKMADTKNQESCTIKMSLILKHLIECNWLEEGECEEIQREYKMFIQEHASSQTFKTFDPSSSACRVDIFLMEKMATSYKKLWKVVSMLMLTSHGQASVERGFSVNREVERDNLSEESHTAERTICDHVASVGGVLNMELSNALLMSASSARQRYHAYLDDQKKAKESEAQQQKRKHMVDELEDLKKKKQCLEGDIKGLEKSADDFADKAEHTRQFLLITKSNTMRRRAKEKSAELKIVNEKIDSKLLEIRNN